MSLYLPIVPSKLDSFDCLPMIKHDNSTDPFLTQGTTKYENKFKIYYNISPLNAETDYTHVIVRFQSISSNRNPLYDKAYPFGIYIGVKDKDTNGTFIEVPAHIFISLSTSPVGFQLVSELSSTGNSKIVKKRNTSNSVVSDLVYSDLSAVAGTNEYYRAQIKLLNIPGSTSIPEINGINWKIGSTTITKDNYSQYIEDPSQTFSSEWSSQIMMKPTFIGDLLDNESYPNLTEVGVKGFLSRTNSDGNLVTTNEASSEFFNFEFKYPKNAEEKISSYKFTVYSSIDPSIIYEESDTFQVQQFLTQSSVYWTNEKSLINATDYYLAVTFTTTTGFSYTKRYKFKAAYSTYSLGLGFEARSDDENGRIEFKMLGKQVRFESANGLYSDYEFIDSDSQFSDDLNHKENALKILNSQQLKNKQTLIFKTGFNSWSIQMIVGGVRPKVNGPLNYNTVEDDFIFKLVDSQDNPSFKYYLVPVYYTENISTEYNSHTNSFYKVYNEFNLVKFSSNLYPGFNQYTLLNDGSFNRSTSISLEPEIKTCQTAYMTNSNNTISGYAPINGSSDKNTSNYYSSPTDLTNKYYLFFGEVNGKMFLYVEHLNPATGITKTKDRLNS